MNRRDRKRAEAERKHRWRQASAIRSQWSENDHNEEHSRLDAEIAERLESGDVITFPPMWAKGSSANSFITE